MLGSDRRGLERVLAYLERERDPMRGCRVGRLTADPDIVGDAGLRAPVTASFKQLQGRLSIALSDAQEAGELAADPSRSPQPWQRLSRAGTSSPAPSRTRLRFAVRSRARAPSS